jgi:hypothetical protein
VIDSAEYKSFRHRFGRNVVYARMERRRETHPAVGREGWWWPHPNVHSAG